jgi:gamma-glutamyltranspeptidase/glutathione hydrolase
MWDKTDDEMVRHVISKRAVDVLTAENAMVAANHPLAALAGITTLKKGGNAVDAAVATHFALAVVEPFMTGIGGGGRCVIRLADGEIFAMNFEPMTPAEERPFEPDPVREATMYKVRLGRPAVKDNADSIGYKAAAIPGFVKGMCYLVERFGNLELQEILEPAIKYAEEGYILDLYIAKTIAFNMHIITRFPETAKTLLKDGYPPNPWGDARLEADFDRLIQKELAGTLKIIANDGPDAFYKGEIATAIAEDMKNNGGYINENDLASYEPQILKPSEGSYRGYKMYSLPVSTTIMQILHILDCFDLKNLGYNTFKAVHVLIEAIKLAFAGRKRFLGWGVDKPPFSGIVSKDYAKNLAEQIDMEKALDSPELGDPRLYQIDETTHACVVDGDRNIAGIHSSLGDTFGCKVTIKGTGIILNNKMRGYDPRPGKPDSVKPRIIKPPPSGSTILLKDRDPYMVIGSPGGYKQVCAVARSIHSFIDYRMNIREAIDTPRVFVESGTVFIDSRMPGQVCNTLKRMGHNIVVVDREFGFARPNAIVIDPETNLLHGGIDGKLPRGLDQVTLGY